MCRHAVDINVKISTGTRSSSLSWDPPTSKADGSALVRLIGFKIYYSTTSGSYSNSMYYPANMLIPDGMGHVAADVIGLNSGIWFFVVTAIDDGGESEQSFEVSKTV